VKTWQEDERSPIKPQIPHGIVGIIFKLTNGIVQVVKIWFVILWKEG